MTPDATPPPEAVLIAERREERGLSIREAARRAGLSDSTWRRIESTRDVARPAETLAQMAGALGIVPGELAEAGRADAAGALQKIMEGLAADPDIAAATGGGGDDSWAGLMAEILAGLADISAEQGLSGEDRRQLRAELLSGLARDAAERRRQMRALRRIARSGT